MAGYFIARISVQDADAYEAYRAKATATMEQYGGRYLVRGGATELREGSWPGRTVVIEFPRPCHGPGVVRVSRNTKRSYTSGSWLHRVTPSLLKA